MSDQPDTVQHSGEYLLEVRAYPDDPEEHLYLFHPDPLEKTFYYFTEDHPMFDEFRPLAVPNQPVRVRLELRAVRVEDESDGE